jgi:AraC-like DNA-binding protein
VPLPSANRLILERWAHTSTDAALRFIVPDGCQDLICWSVPGEKPKWTLSHLQDGIMTAHIPQGAELVGYRFAPGTELPEAALKELLRDLGEDPDFTIAGVSDAVRCDSRVAEVLSAVAELSLSIEGTAGFLGVSRRTLERLLLRHTGKPPVFWSQLARVRAAARALVSGIDPAELAYQVGYSDQAHMSRAVRRWFGVSPSEVLKRPDLTEQLHVPGYDAATGEQISTR